MQDTPAVIRINKAEICLKVGIIFEDNAGACFIKKFEGEKQ
jgi:hypothetical protein